MNFKELNNLEKKIVKNEIRKAIEGLGSTNAFLTMIEDIKNSDNLLALKEQKFSFSAGGIKWNKFIYKDTYELLLNSLIREEKEGDIFKTLKPKDAKKVLNMLKTLKPIEIIIKPKNQKTANGFSIKIIDEKTEKVSWIFKTIFIYNISFSKQALKWEINDAK